MVNVKALISFGLPVVSVMLLVSFVVFTQPTITGLAVGNESFGLRTIDARVTLETFADEIIPEHARVVVRVDAETGQMTIKDFILLSGMPYEYEDGTLEEIGYVGKGFTGEHTYSLQLSDFGINRVVSVGEHELHMEIRYLQHILYQRTEKVMVQ